MARETLKDFLTSIGHGGVDKISYTLSDAPDDGLGTDPNTSEALLKLASETSGLLGNYLKFLVDNSTNEYKLTGGNARATPANRGNDLPLPDQLAENVFVPQGTTLKAELNRNSNSLMFDESGTPLTDLIDKQGGDINEATGELNAQSSHNLLKGIQGASLDKSGNTLIHNPIDPGDVVKATQKLFLKNNRFASAGTATSNAFAPKPQDIEDFESYSSNRGTISAQRVFGLYDKDAQKASFDRLKDVGASLLLKASGFAHDDSPGIWIDDTVSGLETGVTTGIPAVPHDPGQASGNIHTGDGYVRVQSNLLRSKNAHGFPSNDITGDSTRSSRGAFVGNDPEASNSKSFGSTYNQALTFSSTNRTVHKLQAAISIIALKTLANSFYGSIKEYLQSEDGKALEKKTDDFVQKNGKTHVGTYVLGESRTMTALVADATLFANILSVTDHPYGACVNRGIEICFGKDALFEKEEIASHPNFANSPGFWFAVSNSILKTYDNLIMKIAEIDFTGYAGKEIFILMREILSDNKFLNFYNVMAIIGDVSLKSTNSMNSETARRKVTNIRDVDGLRNTPGNRVGKSRVYKKGAKVGKPGFWEPDQPVGSEEVLAWEQSATPSMYILPTNIIRAALRLNNSTLGANPARGMLGSRMVRNTYAAINLDGTFNRIPGQAVKIMEDRLGAEYVPFYFHDLRTNEIISFHAFLDTLSDTISPEYNAVTGYGRLDPVQIYRTTTRKLQVGFTVWATNRQDFDEMWYKINKLVTMLYPQWTQGTQVSNANANTFYQPFSQVIGASPIIRLRVGDVIKSNYSRFALARTFGIGDSEVQAAPVVETGLFGKLEAETQKWMNTISDVAIAVYMAVMGSPIGLVTSVMDALEPQTGLGGAMLRMGGDAAIGALSTVLVNGFANPLAVANVIADLRDPNVYEDEVGHGVAPGVMKAFRRVWVLPNTNTGYYCTDDNKMYYPSKRMEAQVFKMKTGGNYQKENKEGKIMYEVIIMDFSSTLFKKTIQVSHGDILPNAGSLFTTSVGGFLLTIAGLDLVGFMDGIVKGASKGTSGGGGGAGNALYGMVRALLASPESQFMDAANNPFTRAFDTTKGRGLAGVMQSINFNWLDDNVPWETDYNARAPIGCKISFGFDVIHDIPPGLDHSGYNRAPLYNVGDIMKNVCDDPYPDGGATAEYNFKESGDVRASGEKKGMGRKK